MHKIRVWMPHLPLTASIWKENRKRSSQIPVQRQWNHTAKKLTFNCSVMCPQLGELERCSVPRGDRSKVVLLKNVRGLILGHKMTQLLQRDFKKSFLLTIYSKYLNCVRENNWDDFLYSSRTEHLTWISTQKLNLFLSAMLLFFTLLILHEPWRFDRLYLIFHWDWLLRKVREALNLRIGSNEEYNLERSQS